MVVFLVPSAHTCKDKKQYIISSKGNLYINIYIHTYTHSHNNICLNHLEKPWSLQLLKDFLAFFLPCTTGPTASPVSHTRFLRMKTGQRGILLGGWAEMSAAVLEGEEDSEELLAYCKDSVSASLPCVLSFGSKKRWPRDVSPNFFWINRAIQ